MKLKIILAFLVVVGIAVSVGDYMGWRREETKNFGQGPSSGSQEPKVDVQLTQMYQDNDWGVRLKYPEGWKVEEMLSLEKTTTNLPDAVDEEVVKIGKLDREPEHIGSKITLLTWGGRQVAIVKNGDVLVKIVGPDGGVVGEIAKTLTFF